MRSVMKYLRCQRRAATNTCWCSMRSNGEDVDRPANTDWMLPNLTGGGAEEGPPADVHTKGNGLVCALNPDLRPLRIEHGSAGSPRIRMRIT